MEGRNLAKNFFTNGQKGQTRLSSSDVDNIPTKSSESVHFKGSTSNSIISMIDSTLQSDRVVVPATQAENHLTHQKHFKNTKNDCYTGNHNYKPTLANYRQTGGSSGSGGAQGFLPRQITKPKTSKYSKKTSSSALAKYLNADKKRAIDAKDVYMVPEKERPSKYQNSMLNGKYAKVAKNEKESNEPVEVVPSKYEIYARKRENSKKFSNVVLSEKPKIKTEKYEHVKLIKEIQELGEAEQAQLKAKMEEIQQTRLAVQEQNNELTKNEQDILTVDAILPVKSEKKGKKFMLKRFLKDVDTFSSGGSEGAPSEFDAASVKSDGSGEHDFQKTEDYVPGEGLKTSYNC